MSTSENSGLLSRLWKCVVNINWWTNKNCLQVYPAQRWKFMWELQNFTLSTLLSQILSLTDRQNCILSSLCLISPYCYWLIHKIDENYKYIFSEKYYFLWFSEEINGCKFPHAVWQSLMYIFSHLAVGTLARGQMAVHLPGEMLNSVA
jgi:hypothetical protein